MNLKLKEKIRESLSAVLPITGIVLMISIFLIPMELGTIVMFLTGAIMLIVGMGFFQLGAEMSMTPIGEGVGVQISKLKKLITVLLTGLIMGIRKILIIKTIPVIGRTAESDSRIFSFNFKFNVCPPSKNHSIWNNKMHG